MMSFLTCLTQDGLAEFTTIINVPPTVIGADESIGDHTLLNIFGGGSIGRGFDAGVAGQTGEDIVVNLFDGTIGPSFEAYSGTIVNIYGGTVDENSEIRDGSVANVSGGTIVDLDVGAAGVVNVSGGLIRRVGLFGTINVSGGSVGRLNSQRDSVVNISGGVVGDFADARGTFNVSGGTIGDQFESRSTGADINISGGTVGRNLRAHIGNIKMSGGQYGTEVDLRETASSIFLGGDFKLNGLPLSGGGVSLDADTNADAVLSGTFSDGTPFIFTPLSGDRLQSVELVTTNLPPVSTAPFLVDADTPEPAIPLGLRPSQSLVLSDGGMLAGSVATVDAMLRLTGGSISHLEAVGSSIDVEAGVLGNGSRALIGSSIAVSGGIIGRNFVADSTSTVTLNGGEFKLDGVPMGDTTLSLTPQTHPNAILTGTLADGSPFVFTPQSGDMIANLNLVTTPVAPASTTPIVVDGTKGGTPAPNGLRAGQSLILDDDGSLPDNFAAVDAHVRVNDGAVGADAEFVGSTLDIHAGVIGSCFHAYSGSTVNLHGGFIRDGFRVSSESEVNVYDGEIDQDFQAGLDSTVNIFGGEVYNVSVSTGATLNLFGGVIQNAIVADENSTVNIFGGDRGQYMYAFGSELNLFVTDFELKDDFVEIEQPVLSPGETIMDPAGDRIVGTLADGSPFNISTFTDITVPQGGYESDYIAGTISVTLVSGIVADYDSSGQVEQGDLDLVLMNWGAGVAGLSSEWINDRPIIGIVDQEELDAVLLNWGSAAAPDFRGLNVPEPGVAAVVAAGLCVWRRRAA